MDFVIEDIPVVSLLDVLGLEQFSVLYSKAYAGGGGNKKKNTPTGRGVFFFFFLFFLPPPPAPRPRS